MSITTPALSATVAATGSYTWTKSLVAAQLRPESFDHIVETVTLALDRNNLVVPDRDRFVRTAVAALLAGHIVLQGPPGTGKTSIAKILAEAFNADLDIVTATAEWSTYDVIGGLQPSLAGGFSPTLGAVPKAVLACANRIEADDAAAPQATWLLIDEFNRADIDKAIGPLYTVLSSTAARDLELTPLNLWFERGGRRELWVPARFRIIGTMNDFDTSFVNALSQGLTRRFQFISLPVDPSTAEAEVAATFAQASARWANEHSVAVSGIFSATKDTLALILTELRNPDAAAWPLGTAQILEVWRSVLIRTDGNETNLTDLRELDEAVSTVVVPQAVNLSIPKLEAIRSAFSASGLEVSAKAVKHIETTSATQF